MCEVLSYEVIYYVLGSVHSKKHLNVAACPGESWNLE